MSAPNRISGKCSACGKVVQAKIEQAGKRVRCPERGCGGVIHLPAAAPSAPEADFAEFMESRPLKRTPRAGREAEIQPAGGRANFIPWIAAALLLVTLIGVAVGFAGSRSDAAALRDRLANAEQDSKTASDSVSDLKKELDSLNLKRTEVETELNATRNQRTTAEKGRMEAEAELKSTASNLERTKIDLEEARREAKEATKKAKDAEASLGMNAKDAFALQQDLKSAQTKLMQKDAEIAKLRTELQEAERFGPFQAIAGRWVSKEMSGAVPMLTLAIKANGACQASTVSGATPEVSAVRLIAKEGKNQFEGPLLKKEWLLTINSPPDTLTMTEAGGGGATISLAREKRDALKEILKDVAALKEEKRGSLLTLPQMLALLNAAPEDKLMKTLNFVGGETYSTHLNEEKLTKTYGKPDESGMEAIKLNDNFGIPRDVTYKMIRYGWLRIYVNAKGEIVYVGRRMSM